MKKWFVMLITEEEECKSLKEYINSMCQHYKLRVEDIYQRMGWNASSSTHLDFLIVPGTVSYHYSTQTHSYEFRVQIEKKEERKKSE